MAKNKKRKASKSLKSSRQKSAKKGKKHSKNPKTRASKKGRKAKKSSARYLEKYSTRTRRLRKKAVNRNRRRRRRAHYFGDSLGARRVPNAFLIFQKQFMKRFQKENPGMSKKDMATQAVKEWKNLSKTEKKHYNKERDKRYRGMGLHIKYKDDKV